MIWRFVDYGIKVCIILEVIIFYYFVIYVVLFVFYWRIGGYVVCCFWLWFSYDRVVCLGIEFVKLFWVCYCDSINWNSFVLVRYEMIYVIKK